MKKKPLVPQAQILWFSVLHQLSIPGLSPQSQHPPDPATDVARGGAAAAPGLGRAGPPSAAGAPHLTALLATAAISRCSTSTSSSFANTRDAPGGGGGGASGRVKGIYPRPPRYHRSPPTPRSGSLSPRSARPAPGPPQPSRPGGTDGPPASPPARYAAQRAENRERGGGGAALPSPVCPQAAGNGLREPGAAPPSGTAPRPRR